jgi:hypothetical protein
MSRTIMTASMIIRAVVTMRRSREDAASRMVGKFVDMMRRSSRVRHG